MLIIEIKDYTLTLISAENRRSNFVLNKAKTIELPDGWKNFLTVPKNRNSLTAILKEFSPGNTKTAICLNHSSLIYRDLEVPKTDAKTMALLIRNELVNALNLSQEYLIDYTIISESDRGNNKFVKVFVTAIQSNILNEYLEFFNQVGLWIISVDVGLNALFKYLHITSILTQDNSVMIADIGATNLRQYLFEKGAYSFFRNTRLTVEADTKLAALIPVYIDNIEKMLNFSRSQGKKGQVDTILLFGKNSVVVKLRAHLNAKAQIQSTVITKPKQLDCTKQPFESNFVYAMGVLFSQKTKWAKDINLLNAYNAYYKVKPFMFDLDKHYKKIVIALILGLAIWGSVLGFRYVTLQNEIKAINDYLNQPDIIETMNRVQTMRDRIQKIDAMNSEFDSIESVLQSIPRYNQAVILHLFEGKPENISISKISFSGSTLEFNLSTPDSTSIHPYVARLNQVEGFENATYTSYKEDNGTYSCTVTLDLKGTQ